MKRLIYCLVAALLAAAAMPRLARAQAIGEMLQAQPRLPAPSMHGSSGGLFGRSTPQHPKSARSGQIITLSKQRYTLPAKKPATAGQAEPDFTIYGETSATEPGTANAAGAASKTAAKPPQPASPPEKTEPNRPPS